MTKSSQNKSGTVRLSFGSFFRRRFPPFLLEQYFQPFVKFNLVKRLIQCSPLTSLSLFSIRGHRFFSPNISRFIATDI